MGVSVMQLAYSLVQMVDLSSEADSGYVVQSQQYYLIRVEYQLKAWIKYRSTPLYNQSLMEDTQPLHSCPDNPTRHHNHLHIKAKSSFLHNTFRTYHKTNRTILQNQHKCTIQADRVFRRDRLDLRPYLNKLPQLTNSKERPHFQTFEARVDRRASESNKGVSKADQFFEIFPRKLSTLESRSSLRSIDPRKQSADKNRTVEKNSTVKRKPIVLNNNFPFVEGLSHKKPFSQQLRNRRIHTQLKKTQSKMAREDQFEAQMKEEGLFTFYPKGRSPESNINQFLQI